MIYENDKYIISQHEENHHIMISEKQDSGEVKMVGHINYNGDMCASPEALRDFVLPFLKMIGRDLGE